MQTEDQVGHGMGEDAWPQAMRHIKEQGVKWSDHPAALSTASHRH